MSTKAQVRFATRESGQSFAEHPKVINAQFYVHYDGYPSGLGIEIADCFTKYGYGKSHKWEIEELHARHHDLNYIYYIWQHPMKDTWISIFAVGWQDEDECIFVGRPSNLINKYKND